MQEIRLTIRKRAFPSKGRVRLNIGHLSELGISEGEHVDLINEATNKSMTTTVIADSMVTEGQIRISEEDLKSIGLNDNDEVLVRKTPLLRDKVKTAASDTSKSIKKSVEKLDEKAKKATADAKANAKANAAKTADTVKKETKKASDKVGKAATKTVKEVKKTVKKVIGPKDEL